MRKKYMRNIDTMYKKVCGFLLLITVLYPLTSPASPSAQALAFTCAGCHGTDGSSVGPSSPSIAAMDPDVFIDTMQAYKQDQYNATIMNRIAKGYTDEQIKGMAWFFAKQKLRVKPQKTDPQLVEIGAKLHDEYCEKCHEEGGRPGDSGTLAGQWMPYLDFTIADFIAGRREYPRKMQRKVDAAVEGQGDKAIQALIHYYGSQR